MKKIIFQYNRPKPSCWNCCKLKKSKRKIDGDINNSQDGIAISAPSIIDAIAGYYCDNYWFGDKPDDTEMLCGGREYVNRKAYNIL